MTDFDPAIVAAVIAHMNGDHVNDNLLIARAFGDRAAVHARMVHVDGEAGHWVYSVTSGECREGEGAANADGEGGTEHPLRVAWSTPITERAEIRREIVVLYDRACAELGVAARDHE